MNGENLVYDYRFNVVDEPSEWAFNWDYSECGTSQPTPREHHASMWMTMNGDDPIWSTKQLFQQLGKKFGIKLHVNKDEDEDDGIYKLKVTSKNNGKENKLILFEGVMQVPNEDGSLNDPNVGHFCYFKCENKAGFGMMLSIAANISHGYVAFIPHQKHDTNMMDDEKGGPGRYKIVVVSGEAPDIDADESGESDEDISGNDVATRFTLLDGEEEVARCHMTYRDGSWDPSMGPTVEMIAVKQSRRGEGLAKLLWYHVLRFIETYFTLECLNNDAPIGTIMVKAQQITMQEVEMRMRKRDKSLVPLGYKHLLYDYFGFSVRAMKGASAFFNRRPKDEEAVLYIPLLSKEKLAKKLLLTDELLLNAPKPGDPFLRSMMGKRSCMYCQKVGMDLLRCSACEIAVYCNATCQKLDWKQRHKKWCNKTREELKELMIKEGAMEKLPDGTCSLNMSYGM